METSGCVAQKVVYTLGYSGWKLDDLCKTVEELDGTLVDVRFKPYSRNREFNRKILEARLGERYTWLQTLGNVNYKCGPVQFLDLDAGIAQVEEIAATSTPILMCMCTDAPGCHRTEAAEVLRDRCGWRIVNLQPGEHLSIEKNCVEK